MERGRSGAGDEVTEVFNQGGSKNTLLEVDVEAVEVAEVKHLAEV